MTKYIYPEGMNAKIFEVKSFEAYTMLVKHVSGEMTLEETVSSIAPLFEVFGYTLNNDNFSNIVMLAMTNSAKDKEIEGEKVKNVKAVSTFRALLKGDFAKFERARTTSNTAKETARLNEKSRKEAEREKKNAEKAVKPVTEKQVKNMRTLIARLSPEQLATMGIKVA